MGGSNGIRALGARPKLSENVATQLRELIQQGDLEPGAQLPTESAMVEQFGVSRTVIREAVSALSVDGLVNAQQGRGVFVADDPSQQPFRLGRNGLSEADHIVQMMELRLSLEVESASLAAVRRDESDLRAINVAWQNHSDAMTAGETGHKEDFGLHLAIAEATKNAYIAGFLRYLGPFIIPRPAMTRFTGEERATYQRVLEHEHRDILTAITDRDALSAADLMREHLARGLDLNRRLLRQGDAT